MTENATTFHQIVEERRSVRKFDVEHNLDNEVVKRCLDSAILSANSSNMQLWEFYRIKSEAAKKTVAEICLNQNAARTASEMVAFVCRPDLWQNRQQALVKNLEKIMPDRTDRKAQLSYGYYEDWIPKLYDLTDIETHDKEMQALMDMNKDVPYMRDILGKDVDIITHKSTSLAAQTFMLGIKAEGYDSCPMEGFDSIKLKQFLNLPDAASISMVIGVGKGLPAGIYGDRFRIPNEEVVFEV